MFSDYDNDGDLDLYVLNHSVLEYSTLGKMSSYHKKLKNNAYSDKLLRNDNGKFVDVTDDSGLISNILGFGLGIALSDINNDGLLDMYDVDDDNDGILDVDELEPLQKDWRTILAIHHYIRWVLILLILIMMALLILWPWICYLKEITGLK